MRLALGWILLGVCLGGPACAPSAEPRPAESTEPKRCANATPDPIRLERHDKSAAAAGLGAMPAFDRPDQLARPWAWPDHDDFAFEWEAARRGVRPYVLIRGRASATIPEYLRDPDDPREAAALARATDVYLRAAANGDRWRVRSLAIENTDVVMRIDGSCEYTREADAPLGALQCRHARIELIAIAEGALGAEVWADRAYARALSGFEGPARPGRLPDALPWEEGWPYREAVIDAMAGGRKGLPAMRRALERALDFGASGALEEEIAYLEKHDPDGELLGRVYARETPSPVECHQDIADQPIAGYAAYCARRHRLGCFLQMFLEAADERREHVPWRPGSLEPPTLDHGRFLLGTLWQFDEPRERRFGVNEPIAWARLVTEIGMVDVVRPRLRQRATSSEADPVSRFVATKVLRELARAEEGATDESIGAAELELLAEPDLHPLARTWLLSVAGSGHGDYFRQY